MFVLVAMLSPALGAAATTGAPASGSSELDELMGLLSQRKHGEVSYVEQDYLAILERPVTSKGVLIYDAPNHLEKRTLWPKAESLSLDGDQATVRRGRRTYHMALSAYPRMAPFVEAIRETLAGDEKGLERVFEVKFSGTVEDWSLQLVPSDKDVAREVRKVTITGERDQIRTVEILQADGDRSVMTLGEQPPTGAPPPSTKPSAILPPGEPPPASASPAGTPTTPPPPAASPSPDTPPPPAAP